MKLKKYSNVLAFIISATIVYVIFNFILLNGFIPSESMKNTLNVGDFILCNRMVNKDNLKNGDVVVFENNGEKVVKRVIGVSGDKISIKNGKVYLNNKELKEKYVNGSTFGGPNGTEYIVPIGKFFLMGDNRNNSFDSRFMNSIYIPKKNIKAKVILKYRLELLKFNFYIKKVL